MEKHILSWSYWLGLAMHLNRVCSEACECVWGMGSFYAD